MDKGRITALCRAAVETFGKEHQTDKGIEECLELAQALIKWKKYGREADRADVIDELADVLIVWNELCIVLGVAAAELDEALNRKLDRLEYRYIPDRNDRKY